MVHIVWSIQYGPYCLTLYDDKLLTRYSFDDSIAFDRHRFRIKNIDCYYSCNLCTQKFPSMCQVRFFTLHPVTVKVYAWRENRNRLRKWYICDISNAMAEQMNPVLLQLPGLIVCPLVESIPLITRKYWQLSRVKTVLPTQFRRTSQTLVRQTNYLSALIDRYIL